MVTTALISPLAGGFLISSGSSAVGNSEHTSGWPDTRLLHRPTEKPRPGFGERGADPIGEVGNIAPPGRSRLPVSRLITSTSQLVRGAERDRGRPDTPVDRGSAVPRRYPCQRADLVRGHPAVLRHRLRENSSAAARTASTPVTVVRQRRRGSGSHQVPVEEVLTTANSGVGAGPRGDMPVGGLGGARCGCGVDHRQPTRRGAAP